MDFSELLSQGAVYFALSLMFVIVFTLICAVGFGIIKMFRREGLIYNKKYIVKKYEKQ